MNLIKPFFLLMNALAKLANPIHGREDVRGNDREHPHQLITKYSYTHTKVPHYCEVSMINYMTPQEMEYHEMYNNILTMEDFENVTLNNTCPSIEIIDSRERIYCSKMIKAICLQVQEILVKIPECIINSWKGLAANRLYNIKNFGFSNDSKVSINEPTEPQTYVKRSIKDNNTNVGKIGNEVGSYNVDHFERDILKLISTLKHSLSPQHSEVRASLMQLLEDNPAVSLMLRVDQSVASLVEECIEKINGGSDIRIMKNTDERIITFSSYKPVKLAQCVVDNGEISMNDISLNDNLNDIDLLSKWFKLQYIRLSSTDGDINKNSYLGTCLGVDDAGNSSGIFNLNARGYAVINKDKFELAKVCATAGTNITIILLNNDASSSYYNHLKNVLPHIIKSEELAGSGKEMSPGYRQAMIHLNKPISNVGEDEIKKAVNQMIQDIMINKLKPNQDTTKEEAPPLSTGWDSLHADLRTAIIGLVVGLPSLLIAMISIAKKKKLLCFKIVAEEQDNIELEDINNEENVPLAAGKVNKTYNAAEGLAVAARVLTGTDNRTILSQEEEQDVLQSANVLSRISSSAAREGLSNRQANNTISLNQQEEIAILGMRSDDTEVHYELVTAL